MFVNLEVTFEQLVVLLGCGGGVHGFAASCKGALKGNRSQRNHDSDYFFILKLLFTFIISLKIS